MDTIHYLIKNIFSSLLLKKIKSFRLFCKKKLSSCVNSFGEPKKSNQKKSAKSHFKQNIHFRVLWIQC